MLYFNQVTTTTERCSYPISFGPNVWTHIVFTWTTDLAIYIHGQQVSPLSPTCVEGIYSPNTAGGVVIGKGGAVDVDDFIVWPKQHDLNFVQRLYDFYKGNGSQ